MRPSDRLESDIMAERLTPPLTTMSATMHIRSWHSRDVSLRPAAFLKSWTANLNSRSSGSGPDARPPNVLRGEPAGRRALRSHFGTRPPYRRAMSWRNAVAQPILESLTLMTVGSSKKLSAMTGSFPTYCRSTENPRPTPHMLM